MYMIQPRTPFPMPVGATTVEDGIERTTYDLRTLPEPPKPKWPLKNGRLDQSRFDDFVEYVKLKAARMEAAKRGLEPLEDGEPLD